MKKLLIATAFALLFSVPSPAQKAFPKPTWGVYQAPVPEKSMEQMIAARKKLIERYVLADPRIAWGVSVCGGDDMLTDAPSSWLTVYVYSDQLEAFALDFDKFSTKNVGGSRGVDGITVVVEVVKRKAKGEANGQPKTERNDRQPEHQNGRSRTAVSSRPSRA